MAGLIGDGDRASQFNLELARLIGFIHFSYFSQLI
jgi:hypothetical protein